MPIIISLLWLGFSFYLASIATITSYYFQPIHPLYTVFRNFPLKCKSGYFLLAPLPKFGHKKAHRASVYPLYSHPKHIYSSQVMFPEYVARISFIALTILLCLLRLTFSSLVLPFQIMMNWWLLSIWLCSDVTFPGCTCFFLWPPTRTPTFILLVTRLLHYLLFLSVFLTSLRIPQGRNSFLVIC